MTDKNELMITAYEMGYEFCKYSFYQAKKTLQNSEDPNEIWMNGTENSYPISDMVKESQSPNSHTDMIRTIENELDFNPETQDWDNEGIYGIIENASVSWEAGAYDALLEREFNPSRVPFIDE